MFENQEKYEENYVKYNVFIKNYFDQTTLETWARDSSIGSKYPEAVVELRNKLVELIDKNTEGFIWNQEKPSLRIHHSLPDSYFYQGKMYFGDSMDDEWLIVWLMFQISLEFPGIAINITDNDGEFILAEAAVDIPCWISPENSKNRVYIYKGKVHIAPIQTKTQYNYSQPGSLISVSAALSALNGNEKETENFAVSKRIFAKIKEFPAKKKSMTHQAYCTIPRHLALVLSTEPQLISTSVQSFYCRDPISLRHCQRMETFPPADLVKILVKFNRVQYAKIATQEFKPPPIFNLPESSSPEYKSHLLGIKIACGFEMVYKNRDLFKKNVEKKTVSALNEFVKDLSAFEFFSSSSKDDLLLNEKTRQSEVRFYDATDNNETDLQAESLSVVKSSMFIDEVFDQIKNKKIKVGIDIDNSIPEDSDSWMEITSESLDQLLNDTQKKMYEDKIFDGYFDNGDDPLTGFTQEEKEAASKLKHVAFNIQSFLKSESSYRGAELVDADYSDDLGSDGDDPEAMDFLKDIKSNSLSSKAEIDTYGDDAIEDSDEEIDIDPNSVFENISKLIGYDELDTGINDGINFAKNDQVAYSEPSDRKVFKKIDKELSSNAVLPPHKNTPLESSLTIFPESGIKATETHSSNENQSILRNSEGSALSDSESPADSSDDENSIEIEENMIKNLIESFKSQQGLSGPASVMFNQFSYNPPKEFD